MPVIFLDLFNYTAGTRLDGVGASWTLGSGDMRVYSGGYVGHTGGTTYDNYTWGGSYSADVDITCVLEFIGSAISPDRKGLLARYTNTNNMYFCWYNYGTGIQLYKNVGGSWTQLGATYAYTMTSGSTLTLRLRVEGSSLAVYINGGGSPIISATDSTHATGTCGLRSYSLSQYNAGWTTATGGIFYASAQADDLASSTQDATHVATGGATSGGSAESSREVAAQGSGGATSGGAATTSREVSAVGSGGASSGGAASTSREVLSTGSGGAASGGAAQTSKEAGHVASGGAVSGGAADASSGEATQDASHTASGGAVSGGSAASSRESVYSGEGGAVSGGQAEQAREATTTGSGGAVSGGAAVASASTAGDSEDVAVSVVSGEFVSDITIEVAGMLWVEYVVPGSIH